MFYGELNQAGNGAGGWGGGDRDKKTYSTKHDRRGPSREVTSEQIPTSMKGTG